MSVENRSTVFLDIDDTVLVSIAKLNIFLATIDSGLQSLIHGLLKVNYCVGASITTELGTRDVEFILWSLAHELQKNTTFEKGITKLLLKVSELRVKRNALIHSHLTVNSTNKSISWSRTTAKGKLSHSFSKITYQELEDFNQEAQNLISDVILLHGEIDAIW